MVSLSYIQLKNMASRIHKKNRALEEQPQPYSPELHQNQLFSLEYLHHSIAYLLAPSQDHHQLQLDPDTLNLLLSHNPASLGLHFSEKIKLMKQNCPPEQYLKDYQESGEFINYDLSKEHQLTLHKMENELRQEQEKQLAVKRLFPRSEPAQQISQISLAKHEQRLKDHIFTNLLRNLDSRITEGCHNQLNPLADKQPLPQPEPPSLTISLEHPHHQPPKNRKKGEVKKKGAKSEKSRKIAKPCRKGESRGQHQQYFPKAGKKGAKSEELISNFYEKRHSHMDSGGPESSQFIRPRRSHHNYEEKHSRHQNSSCKDFQEDSERGDPSHPEKLDNSEQREAAENEQHNKNPIALNHSNQEEIKSRELREDGNEREGVDPREEKKQVSIGIQAFEEIEYSDPFRASPNIREEGEGPNEEGEQASNNIDEDIGSWLKLD